MRRGYRCVAAVRGRRSRGRLADELVPATALVLDGRSDLDVFATAVADGYVVLTENVADFARRAVMSSSSSISHTVLSAGSWRWPPAWASGSAAR